MREAGSTYWLLLLALATTASAVDYYRENQLRPVYSWRSLDFAYNSPKERQEAINNGSFKPGAAIPIDTDIYFGSKGPVVFITIPRLEDGVPVTLGYVTDAVSAEGNPLITPYPNWNWNKVDITDCNGLISVFRVMVDECGRLWVMDTGVIGAHMVCAPQLLSFSLATGKVLSRYRFPQNQYEDRSLFVTPVVDVRNGRCDDTFVYIADVTGFAMLVYDHNKVRSWKITNNLFYPYPQYGTMGVANETFDLMDGILGMALGPVQRNGDRTLYFHSLASKTESYVQTSVIRNFTLFEDTPHAAARSFKAFPMERSSHAAAEASDRNGVLYFGLLSDISIACWNSKHFPKYGGKNIETLVVNKDTLQFASGIKVVRSPKSRDELWILTCSFQRYMTGSLHSNRTNFRIQAGFIDELVRGTKCDVAALDRYKANQ